MISEVSEPVDVVHVDRPQREFDHGRGAGEPHERGQFGSFGQGEATEVVVPGHVVGERAVEIAQLASIAIAGGMRVDELAHVPLSFPTYAGILGRVAATVTRQLNRQDSWQPN